MANRRRRAVARAAERTGAPGGRPGTQPSGAQPSGLQSSERPIGGRPAARPARPGAGRQRGRTTTRGLRPPGMVIGVISGVVVLIVAIVALSLNSSTTAYAAPLEPAPASLVHAVTTVPASALNQVGTGLATLPPTVVKGPLLRAAGKPEMLYVGAEYCPYCAFERWAMIVALSRFGHFHGLDTIRSSSIDVFKLTDTFSFVHVHYTSRYLTFVPRELYTNIPQGTYYKPLQTMTAQQTGLFTKYNSTQSFPFVDVGNRYINVGLSTPSNHGTADIHGHTWQGIARALSHPSTSIAQAVLGAANQLTAEICTVTGGAPRSVCRTPGVTAAASHL